MVPATTSLTGFSGETIWPLGQLRLLVTIGHATHSTRAWMNFMVVKSMSPYKGIIGRPGLKAIQKVPSTVHGMLKFPVEGGIATIRNTILIPAECESVTTSPIIPEEEKSRPANFTVALRPDFLDQEVVIGGSLSDKGRTALCSVLKKNLDIFAWQPSDMTGVPRSIAEHRLNIREGYSPVRQKKRGQAPERAKAIQAEGVYCYTKMPFGLKNAGATYQRLMDKAFESQVGRNIEVYVDDLVVKRHTEDEMTAKAEQAFRQLKQHLSELPLLVAPKPQEELIMYLSATYGAVSAVLMTEWGTTQTPIYFISRALQGPELNYSPMEKLVLSLVFAAKRLRRYFQAHPITVITDQPIKQPTKLGTYVDKEDKMIKYLKIVRGLISGFTTFSISQVPRSKNKKANALSKITSTSFAHLSKQILVEVLENKSIKDKEVATVIKEDGPTWMTQLVEYLKEGVLLEDKKEARKLRLKAHQYELMEGVLYRRSFLTLWLRCVGPLQADYVMREIQEGSCSMHAGPSSLTTRSRTGDKLNITQWFASIKHPQSNELVERANRSLGEGIKARLGEGNKNWVEELPHVLWAHRTMIKSSHGDTPFSLTYETEAVIPAEIGMPIYRTAAVDVVNNDEELRLNLDLLEERRERAAVCEARAKSKMMKYYNARVRGLAFKPGDFVYRGNNASHAIAGGKLGPKWEGPYEVTEALG
nr:reverse transcriptase domain-containing protein [Tanacetum cinerariifolium]